MRSVDVYLNFPGNTHEAFEFYRTVFGGEFESHFRYQDFGPDSGFDPADAGRTGHISLRLSDTFVLMGSDVPRRAEDNLEMGTNAYINLNVTEKGEAERLFEALSDGGQVESPLDKTSWSELYGSLTDRFGVKWMVNCFGE